MKRGDLSLIYKKNKLPGNSIYLKKNRFFVEINEFIKLINGKCDIFGRKIYINLKKQQIIVLDLDYMRWEPKNEKIYISLFDIVDALELITIWNYEQNIIQLKDLKKKNTYKHTSKGKEKALVRLEDYTVGDEYDTEEAIFKAMAVFDYLYDNNIPFSIAWICRFIDPSKGIDRDFLKEDNTKLAHFIYSLDYAVSRGATIGLHGYTHQSKDEMSGDGTEFSEEINTEREDILPRIEAAVNTAKEMDIPIGFFESPHYASTNFQQSVYEEYFDYIYEPYVGIWGDKVTLSPRNNKTLYIPTPLGYLEDENIDDMLDKIRDNDDSILKSFFYHTFKENKFIKIINSDNLIEIEYNENSYLKQIINEIFNEDGYFTKINKLEAGD
ncbi:hypothetical protein SAMN02745163_00568 [Clostridium cavendishii DSM 21758]|uniref:DUF2334 domain-containing protein n=1 Tax=Clostridium cavendishii DSM 21758 TaxID=1121302 RepID=A0A1M6CWG8_9CLOT|nr:DUF2334 domain-containing protein [Clostridium cavendishii]SHI65191.1 hypothetical protein SAMN02745163_00568 [Clostridium cavendishii DSM 21758]